MKEKFFDYSGYSEEKLAYVCGDEVRSLGNTWKPGIVELYSYGKILRDYGFFPRFLPIYIYHVHSAGPSNYPKEHEINSGAYCMFVNNFADRKKFLDAGVKRCEIMKNPFLFFREQKHITQASDARGVLAFPAHSTTHSEELTDIDKYIEQLRELSKKVGPVSVCFYWLDILKGKHEKYRKAGFPIYSAGHFCDKRYVKRFYEILRHFKYATSNAYGSFVFYAVDLGLPFFFYGNEPDYVNTSDSTLPLGNMETGFEREIEARRLFSRIQDHISEEQREWVADGLGAKHGISRLKMSSILYAAYFSRPFAKLKEKIFAKDHHHK